MGLEKFKYDPLTGVQELFDYDEDKDIAVIHSMQDVEGLLKDTHEIRLAGTGDKIIDHETGEKSFLKLYCKVDPITILELRKKGIDFYQIEKDEKQRKAFFREMETNYKPLKCTDKVMWRPK